MQEQTSAVTIGGTTKTLFAWAKDSGIAYRTLRWRWRHGWRGQALLRPPAPQPRAEAQTEPGYSEEELYALYRAFAGERGEARILADFMGLDTIAQARPLLAAFRKRRAAEKAARCVNGGTT